MTAPQEADATPDEAFELGEVHGYDTGYADGLAAAAQPAAIAKDRPMPVLLAVSPGDLETSADALRRVMRERDPGQLNPDEVTWLDAGARRLDQAAELLRQVFADHPDNHHDDPSPVDGLTWVQRNDGWLHVDILDREVRMRRSAFHGLMVGVDGHWAYVGDDEGRMRDYLTAPEFDEPPRIEDMAPGTTFTAAWLPVNQGDYAPSGHMAPRRWFVFGGGRAERIVSDAGWPCMPERIDPSTIRDVTPPPVSG